MEIDILRENCPISPKTGLILIYFIVFGAAADGLVELMNVDIDIYKRAFIDSAESNWLSFFSKKRLFAYLVFYLPHNIGHLTSTIGEIVMLWSFAIASTKLRTPQTMLISALVLVLALHVVSYFLENDGGLGELSYIISLPCYILIGIRMICFYNDKLRQLGMAFVLFPISSFIFYYLSLYMPHLIDDFFNVPHFLYVFSLPVLYDIIRRVLTPTT